MGLIKNITETLKAKNLYPSIEIIEGNPSMVEIKVKDKKKLLFCSYNYLGLANNKEIINEVKNNLNIYGLSTGGTPLISGTTNLHKTLENNINEWLNKDSTLLFSSGAAANISIIPALINTPKFSRDYLLKKVLFRSDCYILSDELNHATIVDGCRLSKSNVLIYKHKNLKDLEDKLKQTKKNFKIIVSDGIFSMDGDIAPLPQIVELAKNYNSLVIIDDAHSTGVLGHNGSGTPEHFSVQKNIDVVTSALGKSIGVLGGFVSSTSEIVEYLRISSRSYLFSASIPTPLVAGCIKSVDLTKNSFHLRKKLWENSDYLRNSLKERGYNTYLSESPTPIIPIIVGEDEKAIKISKLLLERDIFASAIRYPAVPKGSARIRFTTMSTHTREQIDYLINSIEEINKIIKIK